MTDPRIDAVVEILDSHYSKAQTRWLRPKIAEKILERADAVDPIRTALRRHSGNESVPVRV